MGYTVLKKPGAQFTVQLKQDQHTTATLFQNQYRNRPAKAQNMFSHPHHTVEKNNEILVTPASQLVPSRQLVGRILNCSCTTLVGLLYEHWCGRSFPPCFPISTSVLHRWAYADKKKHVIAYKLFCMLFEEHIFILSLHFC